MVGKYPIITLCGSEKFKNQNIEVLNQLTINGNIVLTNSYDVDILNSLGEDESIRTEEMLSEMNRIKIDMSDSIYVVNVGGYIGTAMKHEIDYALFKEIVCAVYRIVQNRIFTGFLKFWNVVKRCGFDTVTNTQLTSN